MRRRGRGLSFRRKKKKKLNMHVLQEALIWILSVMLSFGLACTLVFFFGRTVSNIGQSMEPTIYSGDTVLVNQFIYMLRSPKYNDIVVFKPNGNVNAHYYMKRVVGKPGDHLQIKNGRVFINGEVQDEYISTEAMEYAGIAEEEIVIGEGEYFVLGDNRNASEDSRSPDIGLIKEEDILGKAWFIWAPKDHIGIIN